MSLTRYRFDLTKTVCLNCEKKENNGLEGEEKKSLASEAQKESI